MKQVFIILGAPRSGTSVVSHVLSKLGVDFGNPEHFLDPKIHRHNPIFFELAWVNRCNDDLLSILSQHLGLKEYHWLFEGIVPIGEDFLALKADAIGAEIEQLIKQEWNEDSQVIGIKDPRICYTFPIWRKILEQLGYQLNVLLVVRNPASFLESSQQLYKHLENSSTLDYWLQHNLLAVYFSRDFSPYILCYEHLMVNPFVEVQRLSEHFGFDPTFTNDAAAVVDSAYWHHQSSEVTGLSIIDSCYQLLTTGALTELREIYPLYRDLYLLRIQEVSELKAKLQETQGSQQWFENQFLEVQKQLSYSEGHLAFARNQVTQLQTDLSQSEGHLAFARNQVTQLQQELSQSNQRVDQLQAEISGTQQQLHQMQIQLQQTQGQLTQLQQKSNQKIGQLTSKLQKKQSRILHLRSQLEESQSQIQEMESSKFWRLRQRWFQLKQKFSLIRN